MAAKKFSISTTQELFDALEELRDRRGQGRSDIIEMLLREHPMVDQEIARRRMEQGPPGSKKERSPEELRALARTARRQWAKRQASGEVAFLDR